MAFIKKSNGSSSKTATKPSWSSSSRKQVSMDTFNQMIRDRAYFIWEERGKPQGQDFEIWSQAEKDISKKYSC